MSTLWLVDEDHRKLTPNRYHEGYKPTMIRPIDAVVYHYTGSRRPTGTLKWLTMESSGVSAHFLVERNGEVWQLAPLDERCWHAGGRTSRLPLDGHGNVNGRTIGIEVMNVGPLLASNGGYVTPGGKPFTGPGVSAEHKDSGRWDWIAWEAYTIEQTEALCELTKKLVAEFPVLGKEPEKRLVGHEDVDPVRKSDPGPVFPWDAVRRAAGEAWSNRV